MARETYSIEILAELTKARKSIEDFSKDSQKSFNSLNITSAVTAIATGFGLVKDIAGGTFREISQFVGDSVNEAIDAEKALKSLSVAMKLVGDFTEEALKQFDDLATELARTTKFTDDQVIAAAALAKSYSLTNTEAKKVVKTASDLSAVTGDDLTTSVDKLARSYNGFTDKSLAKLLPQLKSLTTEQKSNGDLVDIVAERYDGAAQKLNTGFGSALDNLAKQISEFKEELGKTITQNPEFVSGLKTAANAVVFLTQNIDKLLLSFRLLATFSFSPAAALTEAAKAVLNLTKNTEKLSDIEKIRLANAGRIATENQKASEIEIKSQRDLINKRTKALEDFNAIRESVEKAGLSDIEKINKEAFDQIEIIKRAVSTGAIENTKSTQQLIANLEIGRAIKVAEKEQEILIKGISDRKKLREEEEARVRKIVSSPIGSAISGDIKSFKDLAVAGTSFAASILKGADGARKLVSDGIGAAANAIIPGIGGAVSEIIDVLAQGPEKVREMIRGFVKALPEIISNIVQAIPVLIEELAKAFPVIIEKLAEQVPVIVEALVKSMPIVASALAAQSPAIAIAIINGIIENIPEMVEGFAEEFLKIPEKFVKKLLDLIPGAGGILGGGGEEGGGIIGGVVNGFKKAVDAINPFNLTEAGATGPTRDRLTQAEAAIETPVLLPAAQSDRGQAMTVNLVVGQQELARVMLELNRGGFRTA